MTTLASSITKNTNLHKKPLFSFGVITDIQYADIPNGTSFFGTPRYYRHSLEALHKAVHAWNKDSNNISFVINFGDLVDGRCPKEQSITAVEKVLKEFKRFTGGPVYHLIGNHCLYNLPRKNLNNILNITSYTSDYELSYYDFSPHPGFRIVVIDTYDISVLGWPENHPHSQAAWNILNVKNPNEDKNSPAGLLETDQRYVMFNGGVGSKQLQWLDKTLKDSKAKGEKVILGSHVPLYRKVTFPDSLVWNAEEVMEVVHKYDCVVVCFYGHKHEGGYGIDGNGISHRVLEAVLECPPGQNSFGRADVYEDRLVLVGNGRMLPLEVSFR